MSSVVTDIENATERISVLLVDDQAIIAEGVRRMLATDATISFHYVSDPKQALESAERIGPTVILQDLVMPGVDGLDLLKKYRSNPLTQAVPVIVLSTKEEPAIKRTAFEAGANDYLVKLPDRIEMLARVRLHSEGYVHLLQRQAAFRALELSQQELMEKNSELIRLNDKLEEANRFKSEFFANISHEVRTPLIGVLGMGEILSHTSLSVHQRELLDVMRTSCETLLRIINDILDLSKIESGKLELESIPFALHDAIDQTMDLLAPSAFGKGLEISAWIDPRLPSTVLGDITRLRQVLLNLINNAIKFTSHGEIFLQAKPSVQGPNLVHFCLEDTGIGIPPEKLDRLFRSFSQVDASTARRFGGTGLGLSICRNLTALMGGRIWVESTAGEGSLFHFVIPLPAATVEEVGNKTTDASDKRVLALVQNARLTHLLTTWADELGLELIVRPDQPKYLGALHLDCLIVDADRYKDDILQISQTKARQFLLLTRSKNISELADRYPDSTVLSLPLKKRRFLQAIAPSANNDDVSGPPGRAFGSDPTLSKLSILVADDNPVNRFICIAQLKKLGVRKITEAEDGRQAIDAAQNEAFDLILMDVQMPGIDGLQATQQIRLSVPNARQPRIVALTASALNEERDRCLGAGMDDKISKPVLLSELHKVLQALSKRLPLE